MKKMRGEHLKSMDRTLTIMRMHLNRQKVPKYAAELKRDIRRLEQIEELVEYHILTPMFSSLEDTACDMVC